jgi:hypothetical protein
MTAASPADIGNTNISVLGTVTTGVWQGTVIGATYGGTGVNNGAFTATLGGNWSSTSTVAFTGAVSTAGAFSTVGANTLAITTTAPTTITLPTTGTLVNTGVTTLSSLTSVGTIGTGVWQGTVVGATYGGTGVNNGASTITLAGPLVTTGANSITLTSTGPTTVTLPTTGTLVNTGVTTLSSLTSVGTIGTGVWQGTVVGPTYGGTGVNNGAFTATFGGNWSSTSTVSFTGAVSTAGAFSTVGANTLAITTTAPTAITLPTSGTLVNTGVTTLSSLTSVGTIGTGVWQGTVVGATYGGTGVNNGASTITLAGNLVTSGANSLTLTTTGPTNVTLPTSGTLATTTTAGAFTPLATLTASNSATLAFTALFSATYSKYLFKFTNIVPVTNNVILYCVLGYGAGPTYVVAGYNWNTFNPIAASLTDPYNANDSQIILTNNGGTYGIANTAGAGYCGEISIYGTNGAAGFVNGSGVASYMSASTYVVSCFSGFYLPTSQTYTSIKFYMSSGNISSGTIDVYGLVAG